MRKIFMTALLGASMFAANAQQNSVLLYGNLGVHSSNVATTDIKSSVWTFNPGLGYQFNDNWTAGINLGLGGTSDPASVAGKYDKTSMINFGPFLRYTKAYTSLFAVWHQFNLMYNTGRNTPNTGTETRYSGVEFNYTPAVGLNLFKGFALNFSFGGISYGSSRWDITGAKSSNTFDLTFGQQVNVGISKNFAQRTVRRP